MHLGFMPAPVVAEAVAAASPSKTTPKNLFFFFFLVFWTKPFAEFS